MVSTSVNLRTTYAVYCRTSWVSSNSKRHQYTPLVACGVRGIDVKSGEIGVFKTLINKGFSRLEEFLPDVWQCLLTFEILIFVYEEIGQL
jgi:hypothetical protein